MRPAGSHLDIRLATKADAPHLARIHVAAWQAGYAHLLSPAVLSRFNLAMRERMWLSLFKRLPVPEVWVAEGQSTLLGFCWTGSSRDEDAAPGSAEIIALNVAPTAWRQGIGERLALAAIESARSQGFIRLSLWLLAGNEPAHRLYTKLGWAPDGAEKQERIEDCTLRELRYTMRL